MNNTHVFPLHIPLIQCLKLILYQKVQITHHSKFIAWKASNLIATTRLLLLSHFSHVQLCATP